MPSIDDAALASAYGACARLARRHYENFPVASWLLPRAMRPHVAAIYAFARIADDFADEGTAAPAERLRRLDAWGRCLARAAGGVAARAAARTTLGRLYSARKTAARLVDDVTEYLEEETGLVPDPASRARFTDDVRALIGRVAELEERLDRAARRRG